MAVARAAPHVGLLGMVRKRAAPQAKLSPSADFGQAISRLEGEVQRTRSTLQGQIDALTKDIAEARRELVALRSDLEARSYKGIWIGGLYQKENLVTHNGSVWIAKADTSSKPGTDASWQLAVKRGRDGRAR